MTVESGPTGHPDEGDDRFGPPAGDAAPMFGRERELARLHAFLASASAGEPGAGLLVRGDAGIGKSTLLDWARRAATHRGTCVLSTSGVPSEMALPFAGLHQLLRPIIDNLAALPGPQRDAVLAAFGGMDADAPEWFLIALAALNLLGETAERAPILLIVDDAQWLDQATVDVIAFVARRVDSEPVRLLVAVREDASTALGEVGLAELHLDPLEPEAASALVHDRFPGLDASLREQLLKEAAGNPLALVELPIGAARFDPSATPTPGLPLTARLERAFATRLADLPDVTCTVLLVAAVNDSPAVTEALAAARILLDATPTVRDLEPAIADRLLILTDTELLFRHPLVRSAIRQRASTAERRAAHEALSELLAGDVDRSTLHRAAASAGPDEQVASDLEAAATRANRRGDVAAAVGGFERAAHLSVDPAARVRRLLRAADLAYERGQGPAVLRLLNEAERSELTAQQRVRVASHRVTYDPAFLTASDAALRVMAETAERAGEGGEVDVALRLLHAAAARAWWTNAPWADGREQIVTTLDRLDVDEDDPQATYILGLAAPLERGADILHRVRNMPPDSRGDPEAAYYLGAAAGAIGAPDVAMTLIGEAAAGLRAQGRLGVLGRALSSQAWTAFHRGDLRTALVATDEGARLAQEAGDHYVTTLANAIRAMVDAVSGDLAQAEAAATAIQQQVLPLGAPAILAQVQFAIGLAALSAGRPADAYEHLRRIYEPGDPAHHLHVGTFAVADVVEAAARSHQHAAVRGLVERLEDVAARTPSPMLQAGLAYARPMLAGDSDPEQHFEAALGRDLAAWPLLRARTQLAYGQWLRRQRRVAESRAPVRGAIAAFDALGAKWGSEHARRELRASGETFTRRVAHGHDSLTAQELQIAQMAANGLTNREIAESLFISRRTVSTHLYKIFPKLKIGSRAELGPALGVDAPAASRPE